MVPPKQFSAESLILALFIGFAQAAWTQDCALCHAEKYSKWIHSVHANTQADVATELSQSHPGESPDDVIQGEDCIGCHAPMAVLANGGMSEGQALGYFFTTSNGLFTTSTIATNANTWPHVDCAACHNPHDPTKPAYFNSATAQYEAVTNSAQLCGRCHGNLRFGDTDHQIFNGWMMSKHANTQAHVATEISQSHAGESPGELIQAENCIACHAPTAVLANAGMSEAQALGYFFTTNNSGLFSVATAATNIADWPHVDCAACHDPHDAGKQSYFNSATREYQVMTNSAQLCGQCHGNLRFPDTDHLSYNILAGTGGIGVPNQQVMGGVTCTDCHMYRSDADGSHSKLFGGHTWAINVEETDGSNTVSCVVCHSSADEISANAIVASFQMNFQLQDSTAAASVARAAAHMQGVQNTNAVAAFLQAQHNLLYAESDESGGFHNFGYLLSLLKDADARARSLPILDTVLRGSNVVLSWTGGGTLQAADSMTGPWHDVSGASNPLVIGPTSPTQRQFYRLRP